MSYTPASLKNNNTTWQQDAACRGSDPQVFFWGSDRMEEERKEANAICATCSVRRECLEFAIDNNIFYGTWGGVNEMDRARMRRKRSAELRVSRMAVSAQ